MNAATTNQTVLILGANGKFGRVVAAVFAGAGWQVVAQARSAIKLDGIQYRPIICDVLDTDTIIAATPKADVIVNALNPDYTRWDVLLPPITDAFIKIAQATGGIMMIPGNVYNFGKDLPPMLSEDTPFVANTPKAMQRIAMEKAITSAHGVRSVVIRAGDFVGETGGWLDMAILKDVSKGVVTHMGDNTLTHAWAYLPDLAQVFVRVAEQRHALPAHENLHFAGHSFSTKELQETLESVMQRTLKARQMPWALLKLAGLFSPMMKALIQMRYLWQRPHQLVSTKLPALIGEVPVTPLSQILTQEIRMS
jgi:nucleoside-diphosphate-sugar epimerase